MEETRHDSHQRVDIALMVLPAKTEMDAVEATNAQTNIAVCDGDPRPLKSDASRWKRGCSFEYNTLIALIKVGRGPTRRRDSARHIITILHSCDGKQQTFCTNTRSIWSANPSCSCAILEHIEIIIMLWYLGSLTLRVANPFG